ncbi:hypothetical protein [Mucilaginibacter sp.]|uniref:hypothetical protein n=1 Tax=Mucilaginibacter sp. TaxID=1882438 RepID=UPI0025DE9AFB|nr:hypothetical protein [Mucilaginibacter sp.]
MQQPTAKYFIADTFKITGRGLVFVGHLTEGVVSPGDIIEFTAFGIAIYRKITGADHHRHPEAGKENLSILIRCESETEIDQLRNTKPINQVALIFKSETPDMNVPEKTVSTPKMTRTWWQKLLKLP